MHPARLVRGLAEVVERMGVPIYVENVKSERARLRVNTLEWDRPEDRPDQLRLRAVVTNEGGRNIRPTGYVQVRGASGKYEQTFEFNEGREPILPGQKRRWEFYFGPVADEELAVKLRLTTSHRGSYEAEASIRPREL